MKQMPCFTWNPSEVKKSAFFEKIELFIGSNTRFRVCLGKISWEGDVGKGDFYGTCCVFRVARDAAFENIKQRIQRDTYIGRRDKSNLHLSLNPRNA